MNARIMNMNDDYISIKPPVPITDMLIETYKLMSYGNTSIAPETYSWNTSGTSTLMGWNTPRRPSRETNRAWGSETRKRDVA